VEAIVKQALDSLLTLNPISCNAILGAPALPLEKAGAIRRTRTLFNTRRERLQQLSSHLPGMRYPLQNQIRSRLGEGRIRSLFHLKWEVEYRWLFPAEVLSSRESRQG